MSGDALCITRLCTMTGDAILSPALVAFTRHPVSMTRDLFSLTLPLESTHPLFRRVAEGAGHSAARELMNRVFAKFRDVDKSFVREFQTGGFSARVFELALFAYLTEQGLSLDRSHAAPDFVVRGDRPVAIEVTTTNPAQRDQPSQADEFSLVPPDLPQADKAFVFQIGKALRRKLTKRDAKGLSYWEQPHVAGLPFVIAVGAFHDDYAQWQPSGLVSEYLYGRRETLSMRKDGTRRISVEPLEKHESNGRTIPSGLFRQPEAAHLSAVLFSNAHTVSMFNRVGTEHGLGSPGYHMLRNGTCYNPELNATEPHPFMYEVGKTRPNGLPETFAEGLNLFINPWSTTLLDPATLTDIVYHTFENDAVTAYLPSPDFFVPYVSRTTIIEISSE